MVYADDDLFLAHGRFRIAGMIGWPGGYDSIAAFPNVEACAGVRDQTTASMEFRPTGDQPFSVPDDDIRCPVLGFAQTPVEHDAPQP